MNEPLSHRTPYWFKAKRSGYGWGLPCSWQGWVFFVPWLLLCLFTVRELAVRGHAVYTFALALENERCDLLKRAIDDAQCGAAVLRCGRGGGLIDGLDRKG